METLNKAEETIIETPNNTGETTSEVKPEKKDEVLTVEQHQEILDNAVKSIKGRNKKKYDSKISELEAKIAELTNSKIEKTEDEVTFEDTKPKVTAPKKQDPFSLLSEAELSILAKARAKEFINDGDYVVKDVLNDMADNKSRTPIENAIFMELGEYINAKNDKKEFEIAGLDASVLDKEDFKTFSSKLSKSLTTKEKYEMFEKFNGKQDVTPEPIGDVSTSSKVDMLKDSYTSEELNAFTKEDFMNNPKLMERAFKSL